MPLDRRGFFRSAGLTGGLVALLETRAGLATTQSDWSNRDAAKRRRHLYQLLGDLPDRQRPLSAQKLSEREQSKYLLEELILDLNGVEAVPAYFARPKRLRGRVPAILYNHSHGSGKHELIHGMDVLQKPPYAEVLTRLGYCVLCLDTWFLGERAARAEMDLFKEMLWKGQVLWGMMVYDSIRALDYLISRPEVDSERVGTLGLSMGSTMAWWLAALDTRVTVCVDLCCLTDFDALLAAGGLGGHGIYYYVPSLLKYFNTSQINALIAPRAHLSLAGTLDELTPPQGLDQVDRDLKQVYAETGHPEAWRLLRYEVGHEETAQMRREVIHFLHEFL
ncbi:MAG: dienelactone hydrolase family protein [Acidobacteriota bacterium]